MRHEGVSGEARWIEHRPRKTFDVEASLEMARLSDPGDRLSARDKDQAQGYEASKHLDQRWLGHAHGFWYRERPYR